MRDEEGERGSWGWVDSQHRSDTFAAWESCCGANQLRDGVGLRANLHIPACISLRMRLTITSMRRTPSALYPARPPLPATHRHESEREAQAHTQTGMQTHSHADTHEE